VWFLGRPWVAWFSPLVSFVETEGYFQSKSPFSFKTQATLRGSFLDRAPGSFLVLQIPGLFVSSYGQGLVFVSRDFRGSAVPQFL